jgi:hypothetical protein
VTEQLALEQGGGESGGVDRYEPTRGPRAGGVNGSGQKLLAGAAFAQQQNGHRRGSHPGDGGENPGHLPVARGHDSR